VKALKTPGEEGDIHARPRTAEAERQEAIAALMQRRTKLSPSEVRLFHELYGVIFRSNYARVCAVLRRRGARDSVLDDLVQDVFTTFYRQSLNGIPPSIPWKLTGIAAGIALNQRRGERRDPVTLGLPSSRSERPTSAHGAESSLSIQELALRLRLGLSQEHRDVVDAVILDGMSHEDAAEALGIHRRTLTDRLAAATRQLIEMMKAFVLESE
jgi:RNA polymerase sigma factor (sigma-70 family)